MAEYLNSFYKCFDSWIGTGSIVLEVLEVLSTLNVLKYESTKNKTLFEVLSIKISLFFDPGLCKNINNPRYMYTQK